MIELALGAELSHDLGYPHVTAKPEEATNQRNGKSAKTALTEDGPLRIEVPRDRADSFEPILIPKHERRITVSVYRIHLDRKRRAANPAAIDAAGLQSCC